MITLLLWWIAISFVSSGLWIGACLLFAKEVPDDADLEKYFEDCDDTK